MDVIRKISRCKRIGIFCGLFATLCYTCAHLFTQIIVGSIRNFSPLEVLFVRAIVEIIIFIPFLLWNEVNFFIDRKQFWLALIFCLNHFVANVILYFGLPLISLADVFTLSTVAAIFASMFSYCILKEKWTWIDTLCGIVGMIGVILVAKPATIFGKSSFTLSKREMSSTPVQRLIGVACAFTFGVLRALWLVLSRKWTRDYNSGNLILVFYASVFTLFMTPFLILFRGDRLIFPTEWYLRTSLLAVGSCTSIGVNGLASAVKTESATSIAIIRNLEVVESYFAQYFVLNIEPELLTLGGTILIVSSTIVAALKDKIMKKLSFCWNKKELSE